MIVEHVPSIIRQTFLALQYLHARKIIHRDVKPDNLFLRRGPVVKLGDFGLSGFTTDGKSRPRGSMNYLAPEVLEGHLYSYEADVWSVGVILHQLLECRDPFRTKDGR